MEGFARSAEQLLEPFGAIHSPLLSTMLWLGLGALTIALVVLTRTRWGQAKPISKCVALSVFAHILLVIYAYGTSLFPAPLAIPDGPVFKLKIITMEDGAPDTAVATSDSEPAATALSDVSHPATLTEPPTPITPIAHSEPPQPDNGTSAQDGHFEIPPAADAEPIPTSIASNLPPPSDVRPPTPASPERPTEEPTPSRTVRPPEPPSGEDAAPTLVDVTASTTGTENASPDDRELAVVDPRQPGTAADAVDREVAESPTPPTAPDPTQSAEQITALPDAPVPEVAVDTVATTAADTTLRPLATGTTQPAIYHHRAPRHRPAIAVQGGGGAHTEDAVDAALAWLVAHQESDGHWDAARFGGGREIPLAGRRRNGAGAHADSGITGLALLALLGSGQTHLAGPARSAIQFGLEYLLRQQAGDGNLGANAGLYAQMYCHGIALFAVGEAYAATNDHRLRPYLERGVRFTVAAQHPATGGWRYQPGDRGDTSQFGWQVMSLKTAQLTGIEVPSQTQSGMLRFLESVSSSRQLGLASYRPGERPTPSMTAEALACRFFLDTPRDPAIEAGAAQLLRRSLPADNHINFYYWYYGSLGLFQLGGEPWQRWNAALLATLLPRQRTDGSDVGSWDPDSVWGNYGGRVYTTALATLCLQTYYRYSQIGLPLSVDGTSLENP